MTQQWDSGHTNSANALSNGNLTATRTTTTGTYCPTYAATGNTTGKFYWEATLRSVSQAQSAAVGIGNTSSSTVTGQWLGIGTDTIGWFFSAGGVWNGGASVATWAAITASPSTLCFSMDLTSATKKLWGRIGNGNWNNDVIGNQNPATGTGGLTIPAGVLAASVVPALNTGATTTPDSVIAAFAQGSWGFTAPTGFSSFDPLYPPWFPLGFLQLGA